MVPLDADVFGGPSEQFELLHLTLTRNENHRDREKGVKKKNPDSRVTTWDASFIRSASPPPHIRYSIKSIHHSLQKKS